MKKGVKRICAVFMAGVMTAGLVSCGNAQFNTIGTSFGNYINGAEVTSQNNSTYYLKDGDIYKTDEAGKEGRAIITGDMSSINIAGEKLYFYDNEISTICKANSEGDRIERIAEIYCDNFIVNKDNIVATVITGQGSDDLDDPDNYNVASMKITDRKVTNSRPGVLVEKAKLAGCYNDLVYVEKKDEKGKLSLYSTALSGGEPVKIMELPDDASVIVEGNRIYMTGTVDGKEGLHMFTDSGEYIARICKTQINSRTGENPLNSDGNYIYFENCTDRVEKTVTEKKVKKNGKTKTQKTVKEEKIFSDDIAAIAISDIRAYEESDEKDRELPEVHTLVKNSSYMEYHIAEAAGTMMFKEKKAGEVDVIPVWELLKSPEEKDR